MSVCVSCSVVSHSLRPHGPPSLRPHQAPLSMEFSRQEYQSGLPCPSPGDFPHPGIKPRSSALQAETLLFELPGKFHLYTYICMQKLFYYI